MNSNLFPLAREGWSYLFITTALLFSAGILHLTFFLVLFTLILVFLLYTFRNPEREIINHSKQSLLAPCDGIVSLVTQSEDTEYEYKIEIQSSCLDVGVLRAPMQAKEYSVVKYNGTRVSKESLLYKDTNEYAVIILEDTHSKIKVIHRLKKSFTPLSIVEKKNQELLQSERYGFMTNGITTLYIPKNFRVNVHVGEIVKASESLLGFFSEKK